MSGRQVSFALHATFTPKSDQIQSTSDFLVAAKAHADTEGDTMQWYAWKVHDIAEGPPTTLGIFTTFPNIIGRDAHLTGDTLKTLDLKTEELLVAAPQIDSADVLAAKIAPTAGNESGLTVGAQVILCAKSRSVNRVKRALLKFHEVVRDEEECTAYWYLFQKDPTTFGLWGAFHSAADRKLHLHGHGVVHLMEDVAGGLESIATTTFEIVAFKTWG